MKALNKYIYLLLATTALLGYQNCAKMKGKASSGQSEQTFEDGGFLAILTGEGNGRDDGGDPAGDGDSDDNDNPGDTSSNDGGNGGGDDSGGSTGETCSAPEPTGVEIGEYMCPGTPQPWDNGVRRFREALSFFRNEMQARYNALNCACAGLPADQKADCYFANYKTLIHDELIAKRGYEEVQGTSQCHLLKAHKLCPSPDESVKTAVVLGCHKNIAPENQIIYYDKGYCEFYPHAEAVSPPTCDINNDAQCRAPYNGSASVRLDPKAQGQIFLGTLLKSSVANPPANVTKKFYVKDSINGQFVKDSCGIYFGSGVDAEGRVIPMKVRQVEVPVTL